jgi:hypothetical protein
MGMRLVPALVAAIVLAAGCGGGAAGGPPPRGWIAGVVLGSEPRICPTPTGRDTETCHPKPLANGAFVLAGGGTTRRVHADARGRFRVALPPGRYAVRPGWSRPRSIRVIAGRVAHVRVGIVRASLAGGGEG